MYEITKSFDIGSPPKYPMQVKHFTFADSNSPLSFVQHLINQDHHDLSSHMALQFYKTTSPLFNAIDMVAQEVAAIEPIIWDRKAEKPVRESAVLDLLKKPNPQASGQSFLYEMASYFLITGNNIMIGTGGVSRPPLELVNISPSRVTGMPDKFDGFVGSYQINTSNAKLTFNRQEEKRDFRFINGDDQELWHAKTFNTNQNINNFFGLSRLMPIFHEIEQYNQSSIHNLALLKNGATVKGVLSTASDVNLTDDQFARLEEELTNHFQGAENAGRPMIADGGLTWQNMSETMRDMDFLNLKKDVRASIFTTMRIPLPLVTPEKMTLANMDSARLILYDNAVLPLYKFLMAELSEALFPRFNIDTKQFKLAFVEQDIPALAPRFISTAKQISEIGAFTINELRAHLGKGEIENGDTVFIPLNVIPLGDDLDTSDQSPEDRTKQYNLFKGFLSAKKTHAGERVYSDAQIEEMAEQHGLIH